MNSMVGNSVVFYGSSISHAEYMKQQFAFAKRWTVRNYTLQPGSLNVTCNAATSSCHATGIINWDVSSAERNQRSIGTASFDYQLLLTNGTFILTEELGSVINRTIAALNAPTQPVAAMPAPLMQALSPAPLPVPSAPAAPSNPVQTAPTPLMQVLPPAPAAPSDPAQTAPASVWYSVDHVDATCTDQMSPADFVEYLRVDKGIIPTINENRDGSGKVFSVDFSFTNDNGDHYSASFFRSLSDCQTALNQLISSGAVVNPNDLK